MSTNGTQPENLLWHSNAPWAPTGYGAQVRLFAPLLAQHRNLAISAFYGLEGSRLNWEGIQVFPGLGGDFGNGVLLEHARDHFGGGLRNGMVLTLLDVWVLDPQMAAQLDMACWVPVDHDPVPPAVSEFLRNSGAVPIAMSRFGQERLEEFDPLYVPHAVDIDQFKPHDRNEVRQKVGVDRDSFLIGMVAANKGRPSRKSFQEAFEAFRIFRMGHENAQLYLHTTVNPNWAQGEDLLALLNSLGIPEGAVLIADQYRNCFNPHPSAMMAQIMSTFDVLLNPSQGEGFGIPVLEANACGVPAIVSDFSAMPEVCGAGWKVGARPRWTGQRSWQVTPDVPGIVEALEDCYGQSDAERKSMANKARRHAGKYAAPKVMEKYMLPALEAAAERFEVREPVERGVIDIGWLHDDPGYTGGAELTMDEFASAVPAGVAVWECPPEIESADFDAYVIGNCATYDPGYIKGLPRSVKYHHDMRGPLMERNIFCSPLQREAFGEDGPIIPPAVPLEKFRSAAEEFEGKRAGICSIASWMNSGKAPWQVSEWAARHNGDQVHYFGAGPYAPQGSIALPYAEVPVALAMHETFVYLPTALEPFGRTIVEAWAAGCRIIINGLIGSRYFIEEDPDALETAADEFWDVVLDVAG